MKSYIVPPDMKEREKVIGGVLDLYQFFWILGGLGLGALIFASLFHVIGGTPALIVGFAFCFAGVPFAFYRKNDLTLFEYLKYKRKFKKKVKKLPNQQKEVVF
ncbi:UNVERIFIED_ORG: PrgI family protein [Anoxybacillus amylolyticus]